jgi:hypothetical protein
LSICLGTLALLAISVVSRVDQARAGNSAAPLFLAARSVDDESSPEMRRAIARKAAQRAMLVSNSNLKWKPYRSLQKSETQVAEVEDEPVRKTPKAAHKASKIAATVPPKTKSKSNKNSAGNLRDEILQVRRQVPDDSAGDPFGEIDNAESLPKDDMPADAPTESPSERDSAEPSPINQDEPFPDETLPSPGAETPYTDTPYTPAETSQSTGCGPTDREECDRARDYLKRVTIDKISIDIAVSGTAGDQFPCECELTGTYEQRQWCLSTYTWKASALCHKPLYFEEVGLERYGHSLNPLIQPLWSGAHFFLTIPVLPYLMAMDPPNECQYAYGYYRPGSCAPYIGPPIPWSIRGGLVEAAVIAGGIIIIP